MTYDKEKIIKSIAEEVVDRVNSNLIDCKLNENQLYFLIDKYLYVPTFKSEDPKVAIIVFDAENYTATDYSFSNIFFNFKNCIEDFYGIIQDCVTLFSNDNPDFLKWIIIGNLVFSIRKIVGQPWGKNECLILNKLYTMDRHRLLPREDILSSIVTDNEEINVNELEKSIDNLVRYNCIIMENDCLKLNKRMFVRGNFYD